MSEDTEGTIMTADNPTPKQPQAPEDARKQILAIYNKRLPNPETGLFDIKSSIDDLVALIEDEKTKARIDELKRAKRNNMISGLLVHRTDRRIASLEANLATLRGGGKG